MHESPPPPSTSVAAAAAPRKPLGEDDVIGELPAVPFRSLRRSPARGDRKYLSQQIQTNQPLPATPYERLAIRDLSRPRSNRYWGWYVEVEEERRNVQGLWQDILQSLVGGVHQLYRNISCPVRCHGSRPTFVIDDLLHQSQSKRKRSRSAPASNQEASPTTRQSYASHSIKAYALGRHVRERTSARDVGLGITICQAVKKGNPREKHRNLVQG